jgi:ribose transport system ATP-binding protein
MPEPILELIDICKSYPGVQALSHVNLTVAAGEVVGLIGENGAGKSTLMRILGGVTQPSSGMIGFGASGRAISRFRRRSAAALPSFTRS